MITMHDHRADSLTRFSGGVVSDIGFGHRIESLDDEYFHLSQQWARVAHEGSRTSLLDLHPICERSLIYSVPHINA